MVMVYLVVLYALGLVAFTLYPMPDNPAWFCAHHAVSPQLHPLASIMDIQAEGLRAVLQVVMNIVFFMPFGMFLRVMYPVRWYMVALLGLVLSLTIEVTQLTGAFGLYPCSYRLFDVDDLLLNTGGALVGYWCGRLLPDLRNVKHGETVTTQPGLVRRLVAFILDVVVVLVVRTCIGIILYITMPGLAGNTVAGLSYGILAGGELVVQLIMPLMMGGQTIGGWMTGISLDDRERSWPHRLTMYLLRLGYIGLFMYGIILGPRAGMPIVIGWLGVTLVSWWRYRRLPYTIIDAVWPRRR